MDEYMNIMVIDIQFYHSNHGLILLLYFDKYVYEEMKKVLKKGGSGSGTGRKDPPPPPQVFFGRVRDLSNQIIWSAGSSSESDIKGAIERALLGSGTQHSQLLAVMSVG